jgi:hypothetical protein
MIQKRMKGLLVRRRIDKFTRRVAKIQSYMSMVWHRKRYFDLYRKTIMIQRAFKRYMIKVHQVQARLEAFLEQEMEVMDKTRYLEYS